MPWPSSDAAMWKNASRIICFRRGVALAALSMALTMSAGGPEPVARKLIAFGWEFYPRMPAEYLAHAEQFERTGLNGVGLMLHAKLADGTAISTRTLPLDPPWPEDAFRSQIPLLRKMSEHRAFKDSFILLFRTPDRRIGWGDDTEWMRIARNMRILARVAREGGLYGFSLDTEDYPQTKQFRVQPGDMPYRELAPLVRRRARDLFGGVFAEQPSAVILSFWLLSGNMDAAQGRDPAGVLESDGDLWPAFVNGMLDVLPPSARLVDGNEWSYDYEGKRDEFVKNALWQREAAISLVAPENRLKYRGQVLSGSGIYLDKFIEDNPKKHYHVERIEGSRLRHLERNLVQATSSSGGYVWFWGEKHCFARWDSSLKLFDNVKRVTWEELLPGLSDVMMSITDTDRFIRKRIDELEAAGRFINIAADAMTGTGNVAADGGFLTNDVPPAFQTWQDMSPWLRTSKGTFGIDTSVGDGDSRSLSMCGVGEGGFKYTVKKDVRPGDMYLVRVSAKGDTASASIGGWDMCRWYRGLPGVGIPLKAADSGWRRGFAFIRIPDDTIGFTVYLNAHDKPGGRTWFDNLEVYKLMGDPFPDADPSRPEKPR